MYLQESDINIVSLHQKSVSHEVNYIHNHVEFIATNDQESELISKLHATGVVVEVKPFSETSTHTNNAEHFQKDDHHRADLAVAISNENEADSKLDNSADHVIDMELTQRAPHVITVRPSQQVQVDGETM